MQFKTLYIMKYKKNRNIKWVKKTEAESIKKETNKVIKFEKQQLRYK